MSEWVSEWVSRKSITSSSNQIWGNQDMWSCGINPKHSKKVLIHSIIDFFLIEKNMKTVIKEVVILINSLKYPSQNTYVTCLKNLIKKLLNLEWWQACIHIRSIIEHHDHRRETDLVLPWVLWLRMPQNQQSRNDLLFLPCGSDENFLKRTVQLRAKMVSHLQKKVVSKNKKS